MWNCNSPRYGFFWQFHAWHTRWIDCTCTLSLRTLSPFPFGLNSQEWWQYKCCLHLTPCNLLLLSCIMSHCDNLSSSLSTLKFLHISKDMSAGVVFTMKLLQMWLDLRKLTLREFLHKLSDWYHWNAHFIARWMVYWHTVHCNVIAYRIHCSFKHHFKISVFYVTMIGKHWHRISKTTHKCSWSRN